MEGQTEQFPPAHVSAGRLASPTFAGSHSEEEELQVEELDERLTPGSWIICLIKKTAGWGC